MAFSTTGLNLIVDGGLTNGLGVWRYMSSDTVSSVKGVGYFAGCGQGSKGSAAYGMRVGETVIAVESTDGSVPGRTYVGTVTGSTANQASTSASSGFGAVYNATVYLSTTST